MSWVQALDDYKESRKSSAGVFPFMADLPSEDIGWSKLMHLKSEIVIGTMLELMNEHYAPALPVCDCVIVRKSDQELAMKILSEQFHKQTGLAPKLKVN